jgi:hypothetical protein
LGASFLAFVSGAFISYKSWFPSENLTNAFMAADALKSRLVDYQDPLETSLWHTARDKRIGVVHHIPSRTQPGFTLFTSSHTPAAFLISADGEILHRWDVPPSQY